MVDHDVKVLTSIGKADANQRRGAESLLRMSAEAEIESRRQEAEPTTFLLLALAPIVCCPPTLIPLPTSPTWLPNPL